MPVSTYCGFPWVFARLSARYISRVHLLGPRWTLKDFGPRTEILWTNCKRVFVLESTWKNNIFSTSASQRHDGSIFGPNIRNKRVIGKICLIVTFSLSLYIYIYFLKKIFYLTNVNLWIDERVEKSGRLISRRRTKVQFFDATNAWLILDTFRIIHYRSYSRNSK